MTIMVHLLEEGPGRNFRDKFVKTRSSPSTRTPPPEPPLVENQVVIALNPFLLFFTKNRFSAISSAICSFSCFASFVSCLVNGRVKVQAKMGTQVDLEIVNRNLKD